MATTDESTPQTPSQTVRPQGVIRRGGKKKWLVLGGLGVVLLAGFLFWYIVRPDFTPAEESVERTRQEQQSYSNATELAQTTVDDPVVKANELASAAYYYSEAGAHDQSLDMYLQAQKIVDDNDINKNSQRYYRSIAAQYRELGEEAKANQYYDKEIEFIEAQSPVNQWLLDDVKKEKAS